MSEWHVTPDYVVTHWTEELLDLMTEKLVERRERESAAPKEKPTASVDELAARSGGMIKVVRK